MGLLHPGKLFFPAGNAVLDSDFALSAGSFQ
jgi:hypothetical protein